MLSTVFVADYIKALSMFLLCPVFCRHTAKSHNQNLIFKTAGNRTMVRLKQLQAFQICQRFAV